MDAGKLWNLYHSAVRAGNMDQAKALLRNIQSYKSNPPPPAGGCARCRKRFS